MLIYTTTAVGLFTLFLYMGLWTLSFGVQVKLCSSPLESFAEDARIPGLKQDPSFEIADFFVMYVGCWILASMPTSRTDPLNSLRTFLRDQPKE